MKVFLLPYVAAASAAQEDATSLLQSAKMFERSSSNSAGAMNALDASVSGKKKKGVEHNVCDQDEAEKLIACTNFGGFKLGTAISDPDFEAKNIDIFEGLYDKDGNRLKNTHTTVRASCDQLAQDMECMQGNSCWKKVISTYEVDNLNKLCGNEEAAKTPILPGFTVGDMCALTGNAFCTKLTEDDGVKEYLEKCARDDDGKLVKANMISCDANLAEYAKSSAVESCSDDMEPVRTELQCEEAANLNGWRFHKIAEKQRSRRPKGCYHYMFHGKDTAYWNPRTKDSEKAKRRYKDKGRVAICSKEE